jgi:hypothetical protein
VWCWRWDSFELKYVQKPSMGFGFALNPPFSV